MISIVGLGTGGSKIAKEFEKENNIPVEKWDVGNLTACQSGMERVVESYGNIDILVNNTGTVSEAKFENMNEDQWHQVLRINLDSVFFMVCFCSP